MTSKLALANVLQHCGLKRCPSCITPAQRLCTNIWTHMATGVCHHCEPLWDALGEHAEECPAVAMARLSIACKDTASKRSPAEVAEHVAARADRKAQFEEENTPDDFGFFSEEG